MHKEVEIKLEINSFDKIRDLLSHHGWVKKHSIVEEVVYLDNETNDWKTKGITIRLKKIDSKSVLTIKKKGDNSEEYRIADEEEMEIVSFEKMISIFNIMGLKVVFQYSKSREHWISERGSIELDNLPQISKKFIEIESSDATQIEKIIEDLELGGYPRNLKSYPDIIRESVKK